MPRTAIEDNSRMALRVKPKEKAVLMRAAALERTNLTTFILSNAMQAAQTVIARDERAKLSETDSLRVLELLENPPQPNKKLLRAAQAMPKRR